MMNIFVWLFESSLLIVMILGIRKFFTGKISYRAIYALWGIVLLRLILPVNLFPTHLSLENFFVEEQAVSVGQGQGVTDEKLFFETVYNGAAEANGKNVVQKVVSSNNLEEDAQKKAQAGERENLYKEARKKENISLPDVGQREDTKEKEGNFISALFAEEYMEKRVLFAIWACVALVMLCWFVFSNLLFLQKVKRNRILIGSRGRVKVYAADVAGSCLYGVFHPSVYLPSFLLRSCLGKDCGRVKKGKSEEKYSGSGEVPPLSLIEKHPQLSQVIAHELTHYRHKDNIWAMVRTVVLVVYWFNPLVWLAVRLSGKDAELYCDEATIRQLGEEKRFEYGEMLIHLAGSAGQQRFLYSAVFMSRRGKDMEKRIRAISEKKQYSRWIAVPLVIVLLVAVAVTCSRAVSSSGQQNNMVGLSKNADTTKTTEEMAAKAKEEAARQENLKESLEIYQNFLKEHGNEGKYRYYSLAELEKGQYVLLTADHVMEVEEIDSNDTAGVEIGMPASTANGDDDTILWSTSNCHVYCIISGEVVSCGKIACSSSGEWIHIIEDAGAEKHMLATDTHHSVSHYSLKEGEAKLVEDMREEEIAAQTEDYEMVSNYSTKKNAECMDWFDEFSSSPSVLFFTNPAVENVGKKEPRTLELTKDTMNHYAKRILSHASSISRRDVTGDGVKDTICVDFDKVEAPAVDTEKSVTVVSGSSGEEIYGLNVNLVHGNWKGVFLCRYDRRRALMTWEPAMYQGIAKYQWEIFDLSEDGKEIILAQDSFSFDLNHVKEDDPEKLEKFVEKLNFYLKNSIRLVLVSDGRLLEGGSTDYERGGHYKGEFDSEGNWNVTYTAEQELKAMREALEKQQ